MPQISKESIEKVLAATDIVDLIGSYIPLKRAGSAFKGLCPFHHEKSPSFNVNPARQTFHCFGCQKSGDAISFVRDHENLPFMEAVRKLANRAGVHLIEEESNPNADRERRTRGKLLDLHREITNFCHELLLKDPAAKHAREYLKSRGYGKEMAVRWQVGWMPDSAKPFLDWAREKKISGRDLVDSGVAALRDENNPASGIYLRFRDRLMFPIRNEIGDVIAFSGRQLRLDPKSGKYVNSPETALFRKSRVLFGLDRAKKPILKEQCALICEGQLDVIACHEHGIAHAIASQGTAFTTEHARLLHRYTKAAILCFDADGAGFKAVDATFRELAPESIDVRVVEMPPGDDPDSYLKANGAEAFRELLGRAREYFDFKLDRFAAAGLLATATGRAQAANECAALLAIIQDPLSRDSRINHVATRLQVGGSDLRQAVARALQKIRSKASSADAGTAQPVLELTPLDPVVAYLCHLALASATAQHALAEQYEAIHEAGEFLEGVDLLEKILSARPDPAQPAAVNAFRATLRENERMALALDATFAEEGTDDPANQAETAMARLMAKALMKRDARIKAELGEPGLSSERLTELLIEANEVKSLLKGIGQRFVFDDDHSGSSRGRENKPFPPKKYGGKP